MKYLIYDDGMLLNTTKEKEKVKNKVYIKL